MRATRPRVTTLTGDDLYDPNIMERIPALSLMGGGTEIAAVQMAAVLRRQRAPKSVVQPSLRISRKPSSAQLSWRDTIREATTEGGECQTG